MRRVFKAATAGAAGFFLFACATTGGPAVPAATAPAASGEARTPFTLSLVGEAPRLEADALKPDLGNATDLAYCAVVNRDNPRSGAEPFMERLRALVGGAGRAEALLQEAMDFDLRAFDYARRGGDAGASAYLKSGAHARACRRAIDPTPDDPADCAVAFEKNDVSAALRHGNTHETSITYDGRYMAVLVRDEARNRITVLDLEARTRRVIALSDTRYELDAPSISGDGKWIAVQAMTASKFTDPNGVLIIPVDGGRARYVSAPGINYGPPAISPRGDKVLYGKYDTGYRDRMVDGALKRVREPTAASRVIARRLYERDLATGAERRLSEQAFQSVLDPVYAPDGRGAVFRFMSPIGPDGLPARPDPIPFAGRLTGNYRTYLVFGEELPLWPEPAAPLEFGEFSAFGPDGRLYGYDRDAYFKADPETGERRIGFRLWRKAPGAEDVEIVDSFDWVSAPKYTAVAHGGQLPGTSTSVSLTQRTLQCDQPGARLRSDPYVSFTRRGVSEFIPLSDFPETLVGVVLPE